MESIIDKLKAKDNFCFLAGATEKEVSTAEQQLGLTFAKEYRNYLLSFGLASFQGHELTGIIKAPRLNVVAQTLAERTNKPLVPNDLYVVEIANIDGIVIWQKSSGEIYKTIQGGPPMLMCKSLSDYIEL